MISHDKPTRLVLVRDTDCNSRDHYNEKNRAQKRLKNIVNSSTHDDELRYRYRCKTKHNMIINIIQYWKALSVTWCIVTAAAFRT